MAFDLLLNLLVVSSDGELSLDLCCLTARVFPLQASKLKAAMIPVAGAVVGGLIGGPIGLIAGFKMAGVAAAVGGGLLGYQGGKMVKRQRDQSVDVALSNLSEQNIPLKQIKDKST